jgi:hypothetical protein
MSSSQALSNVDAHQASRQHQIAGLNLVSSITERACKTKQLPFKATLFFSNHPTWLPCSCCCYAAPSATSSRVTPCCSSITVARAKLCCSPQTAKGVSGPVLTRKDGNGGPHAVPEEGFIVDMLRKGTCSIQARTRGPAGMALVPTCIQKQHAQQYCYVRCQ